ncbi:hypothetical protein OS493_023062 [Desmophyllum pertusum]|uniref:G-protein coupled receptors family 1 profile domain-containing protein n=1 Tax=Desmophyllum pertusum TaxID=174260 RepID=A0A9X0CPY8_9CNID|nr:hypothetical protein OS493_023062 [Desmophyllum pertusum]
MYTTDSVNSTANETADFACPLYQETIVTQVIKTVAYCVIILLSLFGNSIVIFTVWRNNSMRSVTNLFIGNLAASDLLITILGMPNMITQLYLGSKWIFGAAICKIVVFFQSVSVASSILTLLAISFDRFWAIIFPFKRRISFFSARVILGITWMVSLSVMAPFLYAQRVIVGTQGYEICIEDWSPAFNPVTAPKDYTLVLFVTLYVFPLLTMVVLYSVIVSKLWRRQIPGFRSSRDELRTRALRKKVVKMLITVITLFSACWLPLYVYQFIYFFAYHKIPCFDSSLSFYFTSLFLGHANSAVNPYLYALFHRNYREGFKAAWTCSKIPDNVGFSRTYSRRRSSSNATWLTRSNRSTMVERNQGNIKRRFSAVTMMNQLSVRNFAPKKQSKDTKPAEL